MASILVVDDEQSMRELLEILLGKAGHEVTAASDAAGALARLATTGFDLVVTDLRLGRASGLDILKAVKTSSPATEVVVVTAFATTETAIQAMKAGAYDYVLKPFKVEELKLVVEKALERRGLVAENRVLRHTVARRGGDGQDAELIGRSAAIEEVRALDKRQLEGRHSVLRSLARGSPVSYDVRPARSRG